MKVTDEIQNSFSARLAHTGFSIMDILTVDILHEFELGVWKSVLVHLMRMLYAIDSDQVQEMDER
jgi:hypothetical protein